MSLQHFTKALNKLNKPVKREEPKESTSKVLLIQYYHDNLLYQVAAAEDRYKSAGYESKSLFLSKEDINKIREEGAQGDSEKSQELKEAMEWLKKSDNPLLTFYHHGYKNVEKTPEILQGVTTAKLLGDHGLNEDLNKMEIRYEACYGAKREAWMFFNTLMNNGASNFLGDAKTVMNGLTQEDLKTINLKQQEKKIFKIKKKINKIENQINESKEKPSLLEKLNKKLITASEKLKEESEKLTYRYVPLQRGDSLVRFKNEDNIDTVNLPRVKDEHGGFKYARYYICPKKKPNEKNKLLCTNIPSVVEKFKNMDHVFKNDEKKLKAGSNAQKTKKKLNFKMR